MSGIFSCIARIVNTMIVRAPGLALSCPKELNIILARACVSLIEVLHVSVPTMLVAASLVWSIRCKTWDLLETGIFVCVR